MESSDNPPRQRSEEGNVDRDRDAQPVVEANNSLGLELTLSVVRLISRQAGDWRESFNCPSQLHKLVKVLSSPSDRESGGCEGVFSYHIASWKKPNSFSM